MADDQDGWKPNRLGRCPPQLVGTDRRVFVRLRGTARGPITPPEPWPADAAKGPKTNWALDGSPWEITHWKEAK